MSRSLSKPLIRKDEGPYNGITTRLMTKRRQSLISNTSDGNSIRPRFLSGSSIPNSTIRIHLLSPEAAKPIENLNPPSVTCDPLISKSNDDEKSAVGSEQRGLERMRQKIHSSSPSIPSPMETPRRERRRSTELTIPANKRRRSTLESIKESIDQSRDQTIKLVNADSLERRNMGQNLKLSSNVVSLTRDTSILKPPIAKEDLQTQTSFEISNLAPIR